MKQTTLLPAEWSPQSAVQLTWPHEDTDWAPILDEVIPCFVTIAKEIMKREKLIIACQDKKTVLKQLGKIDNSRLVIREVSSNDSWARDHGPISVFEDGDMILCDFCFNGWGLKFPANYDNIISTVLFMGDTFHKKVKFANMRHIVLEGGSIESDGKGTLMTTTECLLSLNRNDTANQTQIERMLKELFGLKRVLWIESGWLAGDDTDGHIDTLARFCSEDTIAYVQCMNKKDVHYGELKEMEEQLQSFKQLNGKPYRLLPLPMADPVAQDGKPLPATYANFLIINGAVLVPFYNSPKDEQAKAVLQEAFPDREIVGINCLPLIKQYGSLHCVTMQYPQGFV